MKSSREFKEIVNDQWKLFKQALSINEFNDINYVNEKIFTDAPVYFLKTVLSTRHK